MYKINVSIYIFVISTTSAIVLCNNLSTNSVNLETFTLEDFANREERVLYTSTTATKILNRPTNDRISNGVNGNGNDNSNTNAQVSETDLYLLGAIEKLVYRLDLMDQRLRMTEELVQHMLEGSNIKRQDLCPANFTRISRNCYHFNERQYNWKSASSMCKSLGGILLELDNKDEFKDIVTFILNDKTIRGFDYWTGGLYPGVLWIWSNSAKPVIPKNSTSQEDIITGNGRCLKLMYYGSKQLYSYAGIDCSVRFRFICEHEDNIIDHALKRIHKSLRLP